VFAGGGCDSNCRALRSDHFHGLQFIEFRPAVFQIASDGLQRQVRLTQDGSQRAPLFAKRVLFHSSRKLHSLRFDFVGQNFGFVGLAGVLQSSLRFDHLLCDAGKVGA